MRRVFNNIKNRIKYSVYDYWRHKLVMLTVEACRQKKALKAKSSWAPICDGLSRLSCAKRGICKFVSTCCDKDLAHRLSEMGFTPGENIKVVERAAGGRSRGGVMIEIKGSKLALSDKIANDIFIKES